MVERVVAMLVAGCVAAGSASAGTPETTSVLRHTDRTTGADIRVTQPARDRVIVEVTAGTLTVVKTLSPGRAATRILTRTEDLSVVLDAGGVSVVDHRLGVAANGSETGELGQARSRLVASAGVRQAVDLLGRLDSLTGSPIRRALSGSHVLLASAIGQPVAVDRGMPAPRARVGLRPAYAAGQDGMLADSDGPDYCWTEYSKEAIAAWIEYEQCVDSEEWWDVPGMLSCLAIYEMRAIGAFSWWVSCVGFRS